MHSIGQTIILYSVHDVHYKTGAIICDQPVSSTDMQFHVSVAATSLLKLSSLRDQLTLKACLDHPTQLNSTQLVELSWVGRVQSARPNSTQLNSTQLVELGRAL